MDGVKPQSSPLLLRRVIINTIPAFGSRRVLEAVKKETLVLEGESASASSDGNSDASAPVVNETGEEEVQEVVEEGCCPYLQIFKGGKLVFTTTWRDMETGSGVQWAGVNDGSISFNVNCMLQGDILIRCRHLTDTGERVSMFRGAFHTGYIPQGILRYVGWLFRYLGSTSKRDVGVELINGSGVGTVVAASRRRSWTARAVTRASTRTSLST